MGRWPPFLSHAASLPLVVVLPEPCRPAMRMTVGGLEAKLKRAVSLPRSEINSSRTTLTTCSEGESAVITSVPSAFSRMSRRASLMFSSVSWPSPRRFLKVRCSLSERFSNIGPVLSLPEGDVGWVHLSTSHPGLKAHISSRGGFQGPEGPCSFRVTSSISANVRLDGQEQLMSDGREERQEREERRQWESEKEREDRLDRYPADTWRPERRES